MMVQPKLTVNFKFGSVETQQWKNSSKKSSIHLMEYDVGIERWINFELLLMNNF